jgi:hypothetical protein
VAAMARKICVVMLAFLLLAVACFPAVSTFIVIRPRQCTFCSNLHSLIHQYRSSSPMAAGGQGRKRPGPWRRQPQTMGYGSSCWLSHRPIRRRMAAPTWLHCVLKLVSSFCRVLGEVLGAVRQDAVQEGVPDLLQQVLRQVPVRAARVLRQQGRLPLLQQLEDQGGRPQVPVDLIGCSYWVVIIITRGSAWSRMLPDLECC